MAREFKLPDYTEFLSDQMVVYESLYNAEAFTDFDDSITYGSKNEADMQAIYTGGIFRTSKGKDRAQIIANPATGENSFELWLDNVLRAEFVDDHLEFFDENGVGLGVIYADAADDALIIQSNTGFDVGIISGEDIFMEALGEIQSNAATSIEFFIATSPIMAIAPGVVVPGGNATIEFGSSAAYWEAVWTRRIVFEESNITPTVDGEMVHFNSGGVQNMRVRMEGINYTFDLTFL